MENGLSKWTNEMKENTEKGVRYTGSYPVLCDCGGTVPIGGDGAGVASFFYTERFEWECRACGKIMSPTVQDLDEED